MTIQNEFSEILRLIRNGDPVDEASINRILRALDSNDRYLRSLIDNLSGSSGIYLRRAALDSSVLVGQPVYYNTATGNYEQALAQASVVSGEIVTGESAKPWGVCVFKHNSTNGDILLYGVAELDITNSAGVSPADGLYYLSGTNAGKITLQEPPVSVPVLQYADGLVFVRSYLSDLATAHHHYKHSLNCITAGTPVLGGGKFTITSVDTLIPGWLPASNGVFGGHAPAGAKFGYNLAETTFANAWPPLPLSGVSMELYEAGSTVDPIALGYCVVDRYGIWWMTDCENDVPWPPTYTPSTTTTATTSVCLQPPVMSLTLWYTRPKFQTSNSTVTSLRPKTGSIITIVCSDDHQTVQAVGDLEIDVDLNLLLATATDTAGYIVLKGVDDGGHLTRGPVVEGLKTSSGNLVLSSAGGPNGSGYHFGLITATAVSNVLGGEMPVQSIRLQGATEEHYQDVLGIGLPQDRKSAYRAQIDVPKELGLTTAQVKIRFWFLARATGTLPTLTLTARVVSRPTVATALPTSDSVVTLTLPGGSTTADYYVEVDSGIISAGAGSSIHYTLTRDDSGAGDGFNGDLHVIRQVGVVVGGT